MRAGLVFAAVLCASVWAEDELASIARRLDVPAIEARKLAAAPSLEHLPDFSAWAGPVSFSNLNGAGGIPPVKTEGFFACDAGTLYLAVRCLDHDMAGLKAQEAPRDGNVWQQDSVEIFVLPGLDPAGAYFQFAINPAGSLFDAKVVDKNWNGEVRVKTFRDTEAWCAVLAVPFAALGLEPGEAPPLWRVNLHRARAQRGGVGDLDLAWSPTFSRNNHVPSKFGLVRLEGAGKPFDAQAAQAFLDQAENLQVLYRQTFDANSDGFSKGELRKREGPAGMEAFLRLGKERSTRLERDFGEIAGLWMAFAYRTAPHQHGLVVQGSGTVVRATRPGMAEVIGRGLQIAMETCNDADHQTRAWDHGFDAFLFKRPYGH